MCLAIPGRILEIAETDAHTDDLGERIATVDFQGSQIEASLAMTPEAAPGDWVLIHAGYALTTLDETEARETFESLRIALGEEENQPQRHRDTEVSSPES